MADFVFLCIAIAFLCSVYPFQHVFAKTTIRSIKYSFNLFFSGRLRAPFANSESIATTFLMFRNGHTPDDVEIFDPDETAVILDTTYILD